LMKLWKQWGTVAVAAALVVALAWCAPAQAHVLESDGDVSAVLHVPPDDAPLAGQTVNVGLAFTSNNSGFDLNNYRVTVRVLRDTKSLSSAPLQTEAGASRYGTANITFPEAGAYRLQVSGQPTAGGRPFTLRFSVRASAGPGMAADSFGSAGVDFWTISAGSLAILVIVARAQIKRRGRYNK
jgi:hypothetical protein